ncbi:Uncharacterised protein [Vibrio cholerae]|nr:Uncharacterised protein [Vibrio cholerae]
MISICFTYRFVFSTNDGRKQVESRSIALDWRSFMSVLLS